MLILKLSDFAAAVRPATPNPRQKLVKPVPVSLEFNYVAGSLAIAEATFETLNRQIPASGNWPEPVLVDCVLLARLSKTLPADAVFEVSADNEAVTFHTGGSTHRVARLDLRKTRKLGKPPSLRGLRNAFRLPGS